VSRANPINKILMLPLFLLALSRPLERVCAADLIPVVDQEKSRLLIIDPVEDRIRREIGLAKGPVGITADASSGQLFVTHPETGQLSIITLADVEPVQTISVGSAPFGILHLPGGELVYGDWASAQLIRYDPVARKELARVTVGASPAAIVADRQGRFLYVASQETDTAAVVETKDFSLIATIKVGKSPFALALAPDDKTLYVANVRSGTVSVIDTATRKVRAEVKTGGMPYGLAVTLDGRELLVVNQHMGALAVVDTQTLAIKTTIKVGRYPEGIALARAAGHAEEKAYVMNWMSGDVSVIDLHEETSVARIKTGGGPRTAVLLSK